MPENVGEILETQQSPSSTISQPAPIPGEGAIAALKFFAWLDLIAGIIGAIWIWVQFGKTGDYSFSPVNPVGVGVGFAVLFQGMFACALFLVIASIAESLIALRKNRLLTTNS
jgi:hypothetical protein